MFQLSLSSNCGVDRSILPRISPRFVLTAAHLLYLQESLSHIAHLNATHNFRNEKKSVFPHIICAFYAYQFGPESVQSSPHDPRNSNSGGLQPVSQMIAFIPELIRRFVASFEWIETENFPLGLIKGREWTGRVKLWNPWILRVLCIVEDRGCVGSRP